jgi:hypothetical protein
MLHLKGDTAGHPMASIEATAGKPGEAAPDILLEPMPGPRAGERLGRAVGPLPPDWPANLLVAVPVFLHPQAGTARDVAVVLATFALFLLADAAAAALRRPGPLARPAGALLLLLAAIVGLQLGHDVAAAAGLIFAVQLCRGFWERRSPLLAMLLAGAAAAVRIDAGSLALGLAAGPYLLLAAAALGGFVAGGRARRARTLLRRGQRVRLPRRSEQLLDAVAATLLCGTVAANLALLGADPWIEREGGAWAFLAVPFLLAALARCVHLFFQEGTATPRTPAAVDTWLVLAAVGWAATLTAALPLSPSF